MVTESFALVGDGNTNAACDQAIQAVIIIVTKDNIFFILFARQIKLVGNIFKSTRTHSVNGEIHFTAVGRNH